MLEFIKQAFQNSEFAKGGLVLLLGGSILGILYRIWNYIRLVISKFFFVNITVIQSDKAFQYLTYWIQNQKYCNGFCSSFIAAETKGAAPQYADSDLFGSQLRNKSKSKIKDPTNFLITPSYGSHFFFYKWRPCFLNYFVEENKAVRMEQVNLSIFRVFGKKKLVSFILEQGKSEQESEAYTCTKIFANDYDYWREHMSKTPRDVPPILNSESIYDNLVGDMEKFLTKEEYYVKRGINYKRGYLLYGPPGNGKTTSILSMARKLHRHLYIINLANDNLGESTILGLISNLPSNAILCLEDIDAIGNRDIKKENLESDNEEKGISLSTILNILDGLYTPHGLIFFMTTNHIDRLDEALIRPGRVDLKIELTNTNKYQACEMLKRFESDEDPEEFCRNFIGKPMSETSLYLSTNET